MTRSRVRQFLSGLRSWQLFVVAAALFVIDLVVVDPIPFVDEVLLGVITLMLARWRARPRSLTGDP